MSESKSDPAETQRMLSKLVDQFSSIPHEPLTEEQAKKNEVAWKKFSRSGSRKYRDWIMTRCKGCCEVCGFECKPILNIHHVRPVKNAGMPTPHNLIALCPNCHEGIHKVDTISKAYGSFNEWAAGVYTNQQLDLLFGLAHRTAVYDKIEDKWKPN